MSTHELLLKKLLYQSNNRGCRESDFILSSFSKKALGKMSILELGEYQYFLSQTDADIWNWINDYSKPQDPILQKIVTLIKGNI